MKTKVLSLILASCFSICFFSSCTSDKNDKGSSNATIKTTAKANPVVGEWKWAGSAADENKNGVADSNEWKYRDTHWEKESAAMGILSEDLNITFNADGTGYSGKVAGDETKFNWKVAADNNHFTILNNKGSIEAYFGNDGTLIEKEVGDVTADFEKKNGLPYKRETSFEMFKKIQ